MNEYVCKRVHVWWWRFGVFTLLLVAVATGCDFPRDPGGTLEQVQGGTMRVGVVGIGFGLWWADAAAAALISLDILKDGIKDLKRVIADLMNQIPNLDLLHPVQVLQHRDELVAQRIHGIPGYCRRLREDGQVYFGEAFVVPSDTANLTENIEDAVKQAHDLSWRIHDLAITSVQKLPERED